jgi:hypothetical protein
MSACLKLGGYLLIVLIFLIGAFVILRFCQSKPTGPVTARQFRSLTNAVRSVTAELIVLVGQVDRAPGRMIVCTGSVMNEHDYFLSGLGSDGNIFHQSQ